MAARLTQPRSPSRQASRSIPDHSLFLFKASVDGKCNGQPVGSENGATVYAKENGAWKALFTMGTPIP